MSLPKRGSRTLLHGGCAYRWLIRKRPTAAQGARQSPMTLAVEAVDGGRGGVLHVDLGVSRPDNQVAPHQTAVTPAVVRAIIDGARAAGWRPEAGGTFAYRYPLIQDRP